MSRYRIQFAEVMPHEENSRGFYYLDAEGDSLQECIDSGILSVDYEGSPGPQYSLGDVSGRVYAAAVQVIREHIAARCGGQP